MLGASITIDLQALTTTGLGTKRLWHECLQALTAGYDIKYKAMALALKMKGEKRTAHTLANGWRIWKLYNTSRMDFHLFFCSRNVRALQHLLPKEEKADFSQVRTYPAAVDGCKMESACQSLRSTADAQQLHYTKDMVHSCRIFAE